MKRLLCFCFIMFLIMNGVVLAGVTGKISGVVKDADTGEALPGANVILTGTSQGAATDLDGNYFIINVRPGSYTVEASMIGYEKVSQTEVRVSTDHTTPVDFSLNVTTIEGTEVTITAVREVVKKDVSSSQIVADIEQVDAIPMVKDIEQYINMQAGIENDKSEFV